MINPFKIVIHIKICIISPFRIDKNSTKIPKDFKNEYASEWGIKWIVIDCFNYFARIITMSIRYYIFIHMHI